MYKILPILLFAYSFTQSSEDIDTEFFKNHPINVNNQKLYQEAIDSILCNYNGEYSEATFEIFDKIELNQALIIRDYLSFNFNSILNSNKFFIKIDSIRVSNFHLEVEHKTERTEISFSDNMCKDSINKDDYLLWSAPTSINFLDISIYIDYSIQIHLIKSTINSIISTLFPVFDCVDCIKFIPIDITELLDGQEQNTHPITSILNRQDIYDDSWAVIIGIDKYKYSKQLNYAVKDAEAVKGMLISKFGFPEQNIKYLTDEEATLSNIKIALDDIATLAGENDRILVFYSGHGETLKGVDGTEKGYIIPYEGKQNKAYATGLAMDEILTTSMMSPSKHMLFLMDACYSGLMTQQYKGVSKSTEEGYLSKVANEKARQIITAGGRDEQVIERDEWQHSAFTKNLLEGLDTWEADYNKDGYITADELSTYLRENVTEDSDFQQTPQDGRSKNSGGGEFVFFSDANIPSSDTDKEEKNIYGCMDFEANNYNPNATKPDRSCQYGKVLTSLSFGYYDAAKGEVPIFIDTNENIKEVSFLMSGAKILKAWGGIVEETGYGRIIINDEQNGILAFSGYHSHEPPLPKGNSQILFNLIIEPTETEICIQDIILSNLYDEQMQSNSFDCFKP